MVGNASATGITFFGLHYRSEILLDLRESVFIKYSLFDLSRIYVYSMKGEFLCVARQEEKIHPIYNGGLKEALLELSIKEFLNEIKDIDFNLINYQIDQFYV